MNFFLPSAPKKCPNCGSLLSMGIWGQEAKEILNCEVCGTKLD